LPSSTAVAVGDPLTVQVPRGTAWALQASETAGV